MKLVVREAGQIGFGHKGFCFGGGFFLPRLGKLLGQYGNFVVGKFGAGAGSARRVVVFVARAAKRGAGAGVSVRLAGSGSFVRGWRSGCGTLVLSVGVFGLRVERRRQYGSCSLRCGVSFGTRDLTGNAVIHGCRRQRRFRAHWSSILASNGCGIH